MAAYVAQSLMASQTVGSRQNTLSMSPRQHRTVHFDDTYGSSQRHDNDAVNIVDVQILPTTDEILCLRPPYMPRKGPAGSASMSDTPEKLLDLHFRQLRYESTEALVDVSYYSLQQLVQSANRRLHDYGYKYETPRGVRFSLFREVSFEEVTFNERLGLVFHLSYKCPRALRGSAVHRSGLFEDGMMCVLLGLDTSTHKLVTYFFEVFLRQSTDAMKTKTGNHERAAVQLVLANTGKNNTENARRCLSYTKRSSQMRFMLADIPNVLAAGFYHHLERLQKLCVSDVPRILSKYIAGRDSDDIAPPKYAEGEDFEWTLDPLKSHSNGHDHEPFRFRPRAPGVSKSDILWDLMTRTSLDEGQALALYDNLSRELTFTQGPPGTGKSFLGIAQTQVILASQRARDRRPIVVMALTNHALDDILEGFLNKGIKKIVRLGSRSKSAILKPYLFQDVRKKTQSSILENTRRWETIRQLEDLTQEGTGWAEAISSKDKDVGWTCLKEFASSDKQLQVVVEHLSALEQVTGTSDHRRVGSVTGFAYKYWREGGDLSDVSRLVERLDEILGACDLPTDTPEMTRLRAKEKEKVSAAIQRNVRMAVGRNDGAGMGTEVQADASWIWTLSHEARKTWMATWARKIDHAKVCEASAEVHGRHQDTVARKVQVQRLTNGRCLAGQDVIGLTSTACARLWDVLSDVKPRVLIIEEASELLEAHIICALLPSIEHCISIGDPLQLRPHIGEMVLSVEHNPKYRLDESLFERMMKAAYPFSRLNVQRRAHPTMSALLKVTDYPFLVNHSSTEFRPTVPGMSSRMYWLDHEHPEDAPQSGSSTGDSKSYSNKYEVEFAAGLIEYLMKQGYGLGDIAVLTPYNGQLAAFVGRLKAKCPLFLKPEDRDALINDGLLEASDARAIGGITDVSLSSMLRIATVDNFQGEEAKVVIFSAVRSNSKGKLGFLKNNNRINVAISRAKDGFYLFGNSKLLRKSKHWANVIGVFKSTSSIGKAFAICCPRHPAKSFHVDDPHKFEAACGEPCGYDLACEHTCPVMSCHPLEMHPHVVCRETCQRILPCGHLCVNACNEPCGECKYPMTPVSLPCRHFFTPVCSTPTTAREHPRCMQLAYQLKLHCGHMKDFFCGTGTGPGGLDFCNKPCGKELRCGHACTAECSSCSRSGHTACTRKCEKALLCGHVCMSVCGHPEECAPCTQPCKKSCRHGKCDLVCSAPCKPCMQTVQAQPCKHQRDDTQLLCCLPTLELPCAEPCDHFLPCGKHLCPSLCGEKCPVACTECLSGSFSAAFLISLPCRHSAPVQNLDRRVRMSRLYEMTTNGVVESVSIHQLVPAADLTCPECPTSLQNVRRYSLACRLPSVNPTIDVLYRGIGGYMGAFIRDMHLVDEALSRNFAQFCTELKTGPLAGRYNQSMLINRNLKIDEVQRAISKYRDETVVQVEAHIMRLMEFLQSPEFFPRPSLAFKLRFDYLHFRCRLIAMEDGLRLIEHLQPSGPSSVTAMARDSDGFSEQDSGTSAQGADAHTMVLVTGLRWRILQQCQGESDAIDVRVVECKERNLPRLEVELLTVQLCFKLIMRRLGMEAVFGDTLKRIMQLCTSHPTTAGKLLDSFHAVIKPLTSDTFPKRFYDLHTMETREMWAAWSKYKLGSLAHCSDGHPYSVASFKSCPECGELHRAGAADVDGLQEDLDSKLKLDQEGPEFDDVKW